MRVLMLACSRFAWQLMKKLEQAWKKRTPDITIICKVKCKSLPELSEDVSIAACVGAWFCQVDAIVFLCAAGIAVRSIAPYLKHKSKDPAVLVLDETGKFCISLLSGHAGGANELAAQIGEMTGAIPVVTTATDRLGRFAVDDFARKNRLQITDWKLAKEISVRILNGDSISMLSEYPVEGEIPCELWLYQEQKQSDQSGINRRSRTNPLDIIISVRQKEQRKSGRTLQLVPKRIAAGIGCRKDTSEEMIASALKHCLTEENIHPEALFTLASIDIKKQEPGILAYCKKTGIPFLTYTAEALKKLTGDFTESDFVEQITGVSNVCERSAAAAAEGRLICRKKVYDGVTVALAEKKGNILF